MKVDQKGLQKYSQLLDLKTIYHEMCKLTFFERQQNVIIIIVLKGCFTKLLKMDVYKKAFEVHSI